MGSTFQLVVAGGWIKIPEIAHACSTTSVGRSTSDGWMFVSAKSGCLTAQRSDDIPKFVV